MVDKQNIVFIVPTLGLGGMERVVSVLSGQLVKLGYNVIIITLIKHSLDYNIEKRIQIINSNINYTGAVANKLNILINLRKNLKSFNKSDNIFISFGERFNSLSILAARSIGIKSIFVSDRNNPYANNGFVNDWLRSMLYPLAKGLIAQTEEASKHFLQLGLNKNIKVINNPLKSINYKKKTNQANNILTIGRLDELKNHEELIDIFTEINDNKWNLIIVGGGRLYERLKLKIDKSPLKNNMFLEGPNHNIDDYLNNAEIFAFTSLSEGFPNVIIEAMSVPLVCISYDCKVGPADIIEDNINGILIPLREKSLYINELRELMNNKEKRLRIKQNAIKVREKYALDKIVSDLLEFVQK